MFNRLHMEESHRNTGSSATDKSASSCQCAGVEVAGNVQVCAKDDASVEENGSQAGL